MPVRGKQEKPIAFTEKGRPIFGYKTDKDGNFVLKNGEKIPVCHSRKRKKPDHIRCQIDILMPNGRCELHGGKSLGGAAHGSAKHLKYSRLFPKKHQKQLEEAARAENPASMDAELRYIDLRAAELVSSLSTKEGEATFKAIEEAYEKVLAAYNVGMDEVQNQMGELGKVIREGANDAQVWNQLLELWDSRRKIASVEIRRQQVDATNLSALVVLDINFKAIAVLREAVVMNVTSKFQLLLSEVQVALLRLKLDESVIDSILEVILPLFDLHSRKTEDAILDDASTGMQALLPSKESQLSPDGDEVEEAYV